MDIKQALKNIMNVSPDLAIEEIVCIRENREQAIPVLLEYVKKASEIKERKPWKYDAHFYAMYLLAEFRVKEAFPHLIQYLEFDYDFSRYLLGDAITEGFGSILASVATAEDISRLKDIIKNTKLDTFNRNAALAALQVLYAEDTFDRDSYITDLRHLLETCHDDPTLLAFIIVDCEDAGFREMLPIIERLFKAKLVDEQVTDYPFVRDRLICSEEVKAKEEMSKYERKKFVRDTIVLMKTWYYFSEKYKNDMRTDSKEVVDNKKPIETTSFTDDYEQYIRDNASLVSMKFIAEKREPVYALGDMLQAKTVAVLRRLGSLYKVPNCSRKKKAEIIPLLIDKMTNIDTLREHLILLKPTEWVLFKKAASADRLIDEKAPLRDILKLHILGIMGTYYFNIHFYFVVPVEIRQLFLELGEGFQQEKEFADLLNDYAVAATNLYGVITQDDFVELFNSQNDRKTDIDEVFSTLLRFVYFGNGYVFWEEYIVNDEFEEDDYEDVELCAKTAAEKPRYLPGREELLKYSDWSYVEKTPQLTKLRAYVLKNATDDKKLADEIVEKYHFAAARKAKPQEYIDIIKEHDILLSDDKTKSLMYLVFDLENNVRRWINNGNTESELAAGEGVHLLPPTNEPVRVVKIGRNEPCPCGSGKKYKKCCGV